MTNWLIESRTELRDLIAQAKRHEGAESQDMQRAIRQAEEFLPRYVNYCNEDFDVAQSLRGALRRAETGAEKLTATRYSDGDQRLYIGRVGTAWRHFHQWKRDTPQAVGPYYPTKAALLLDHDRYATDYGF